MRANTDIAQVKHTGILECLQELQRTAIERRPRATYRLQFHKGFTLRDAMDLVPYLHSVGVSHLYASPILQARAGSMHGYDIVDHTRINGEIGTETDLRDLISALRSS